MVRVRVRVRERERDLLHYSETFFCVVLLKNLRLIFSSYILQLFFIPVFFVYFQLGQRRGITTPREQQG